MIMIRNKMAEKKVEVVYRFKTIEVPDLLNTDQYLYFEAKTIQRMTDYSPKCP